MKILPRRLHGGTTDEGHPYFVMELVKGGPSMNITMKASWGMAARMDLFHSAEGVSR
jgi:hypothetical protein